MIGPTGPVPNLLRQWELGQVPAEASREEDDSRGPHDRRDEQPTKKKREGGRRRWLRFLRRR
jgi:hypothetical protein